MATLNERIFQRAARGDFVIASFLSFVPVAVLFKNKESVIRNGGCFVIISNNNENKWDPIVEMEICPRLIRGHGKTKTLGKNIVYLS